MTIKGTIKSIGAKLLDSTGILDYSWNQDPSWRILMYHRVCKPEELTYPIQAGMYVRPETFQMHCEFLKNNSNVVLVDELVEKLIKNEPLPKRTVAITFDDGWRDNLKNAFPVLKALSLPATVFLPTDFIDTSKLFWTDQVARALTFNPEVFLAQKEFQNLASLPTEEKLELVINTLFSLPLEKRDELLTRLINNLPINTIRGFLNWQEVSTLESFGIKVGSHSHTHRLFSELSKEERLEELKESREILSSKSLLSSNIFVFPGGAHTLEIGEECLKSGYLASLKTTPSPILGSAVFPRVGIHQDISTSQSLFKFRICYQR